LKTLVYAVAQGKVIRQVHELIPIRTNAHIGHDWPKMLEENAMPSERF
jgi:hypothetical protein